MKLSYEQEKNLVKGLLTACKVSGEDAELLGEVITFSDFTGVYSHGLSRLTRYLRQYAKGALNPAPDFEKILENGAVALFDGDNGSGIVTMNKAYSDTLARAKKYGIAFSSGRHNANIGCGSYYGMRAVRDDVICVCGCNTYAFTSPFGGADRLIGTNPIIAAVPGGKEYPIIMDISTTCVAMGKIQAYEREGKSIPAEWAKDYEGNPTANPSAAFSLSPIAGHKGYGLAVIVDMLSTILSGACYGTDIGLFSKLEPENTGFFIIIIDPEHFMPIAQFKQNVDRYVRMMKDGRKAPGFDEVLLPGEIEMKKLEKNMAEGVEFSPALEKELLELAAASGAAEDGMNFEELVNKLGA